MKGPWRRFREIRVISTLSALSMWSVLLPLCLFRLGASRWLCTALAAAAALLFAAALWLYHRLPEGAKYDYHNSRKHRPGRVRLGFLPLGLFPLLFGGFSLFAVWCL